MDVHCGSGKTSHGGGLYESAKVAVRIKVRKTVCTSQRSGDGLPRGAGQRDKDRL
jgi:hypothetical protein